MAMTMSSSSVILPRFVSASTAAGDAALGEASDDMFSSLMNGDADFDLLAGEFVLLATIIIVAEAAPSIILEGR